MAVRLLHRERAIGARGTDIKPAEDAIEQLRAENERLRHEREAASRIAATDAANAGKSRDGMRHLLNKTTTYIGAGTKARRET